VSNLEELLIAARSPQVEVRANAGRDLVAHLGDARAEAAIVALIHDANNTLPTFETALALVTTGGGRGVRLLALALADGDEESFTHASDALWDVTQTQDDLDLFRARVEQAATDPDAAVRTGADYLLRWIDDA